MMKTLVSWAVRRRLWLVAVGLPVLALAWWAFRPEKLWITQKVNEPAPFASSRDARPLYTGLLEAGAHPISGRATVYASADGKEYLQLSDFKTLIDPEAHVALARSNEKLGQEGVQGEFDHLELGQLKHNQGDQTYDLPGSTDLGKYDAVVIYSERSHAVFGVARLELF
jgi:hypothetical protein